ncbi:hypothetical protein CR513_22362, partial [Mucuna pruriens]
MKVVLAYTSRRIPVRAPALSTFGFRCTVKHQWRLQFESFLFKLTLLGMAHPLLTHRNMTETMKHQIYQSVLSRSRQKATPLGKLPRARGSHLKGQWWRTFEGRHDNLLSLLSIKVQPIALLALKQFYDPPLICFTLKDFQLTPTVEKKNQNGLEGIPRASLEERLQQLQRKEDLLVSTDVYGLLIYGIILFPQIEDYVDLAAIDAFLGKCNRGENLIIIVLANTYYTLDYCYRKNEKGLRCCTSLLYLWMTTHLFHGKKKTEWATCLDELMEKTIRWYPQWNERENVIIKCRGFSNTSLMGTQGAINCNPELILKQVRYPMVLPLSKEAFTPFIIHGLRGQNGEYLRKIRRAWKEVVIRGPEWGPRSCGASSKCTLLTFEDPQLNATEEGSTESQRPLKRSREADPNPRMSQESSQRAALDRAAAREKYLRELEQDPALIEKEELTAVLADSKLREVEVKTQLCQLQERVSLLEADVARSKLHNKHLESKRRKVLMELVKTVAWELWRESDKYTEIANGAHKAAQEAREETRFWKERFIKLAWLANQAIMDIPKSLRAAE